MELNGVDFGGILYFGIVEYQGKKIALVGTTMEGDGTLTESGNDRWGYAKIPVKSDSGQGFVQVTSWGQGSAENRARAKAAKKAVAGERKSVLVKHA